MDTTLKLPVGIEDFHSKTLAFCKEKAVAPQPPLLSRFCVTPYI